MQTNTKTKLVTAFFIGVLLSTFINGISFAASLSSNLSTFSLSENPAAQNHETSLTLTLSPEPTDQVSTTFSTNGECLLGPHGTNFATGGVVVTQNGNIPFGLRALDDSDGEGDHLCDISFSSQSTHDSQYSSPVTKSYAIQITDNDIAKVYDYSLSALTVSRMQEGDSFVEQYQINVVEAPSHDIVVTAQADSQCDLLIGVPEKRAKSATATIKKGTTKPAVFTLIPVQDSEFEGIHRCTVSHSSVTGDPNYQSKTVPNYSASILDDDINPNIPDDREYEGGLIYFKDANFDGIEDDGQANVTSFINPLRDARQGIMITDEFGNLLNGCSFVGEVSAKPFSQSSASITSEHGQLFVEVSCTADVSYQLVWLLDAYEPQADLWTIYDITDDEMLSAIDMDAILFNIGQDHTTALVINYDKQGALQFVQSSPEVVEPESELEESLVASVSNTKINPLVVVSVVSAVATVLWLIYRQFFANVDTTRSRYPRVDHF